MSVCLKVLFTNRLNISRKNYPSSSQPIQEMLAHLKITNVSFTLTRTCVPVKLTFSLFSPPICR